MRRAVAGAALLCALLTPAVADASRRPDAFPLHPGTHTVKASQGPRVAALQWLLSGHRPNVYTQVKPTFHWKPNGAYGARTTSAANQYRYRIGYPAKGQCGARTSMWAAAGVTGYLFNILEGKAKRPACWVALAAERVKGIIRPGATRNARAIQLLEVSQLGVHEIPDGSNRGPCISTVCQHDGAIEGPYQGSTGAFGEAWCASFAQWAIKHVTGRTIPAPLPAYVPSIAEWAQARNLLAAKPRVGSFVVFLSADLKLVNAFHIGYVVRVTASGVQTIEGNYANGVHEVFRRFDANHMVYVDVPGVA